MRVYLNQQKLTRLMMRAAAMVAFAFAWLSYCLAPRGMAQTPSRQTPSKSQQGPAYTPPSEYSQRVVAYINDTIPVTREEFGEYLIARFGTDRLTNFINRRIIEQACKEKGIEVTSAEVEKDFTETIKSLNTTAKDFESKILKPHNKTLYEWKEDAVRPRLMLSKMCRDRVHVTEEDISKGYEAYYGEKIECRIIMWPKNEKAIALQMYPRIRDRESEFERAAKSQASPTLAAMGGKVEPIGRHTAGNPQLEKTAFALQPGELSQLLETPEGFVVLKCIRRVPPQTDKKLEDVREVLAKEAFEKKLQQEIPKCFQELHDKAHPLFIMKTVTTDEDLKRQARQVLAEDGGKTAN
jgi:hypothetical protein